MRAQYERAVAQTWRRSETTRRLAEPLELVRYACLAASSHNTQPWRFELGRDSITILPDFSRRCPAVDPDDHHLYASLGCAAENLVIAAQAAGRSAVVRYEPASTGIRIELQESAARESPLFRALFSRQCTRTVYDGKPLSPHKILALESVAVGDGVSAMLLTTERQKGGVSEYVAQGNSAQFADAAWAAELQSWIRFDARTAVETGDGLYGPVMGNPDVPPWLGRLFMKIGFSAKAQNRKDARNIRSSSAIAVIHSEKSDPQHWIEAGRCYERLALQAAALGLRTAFINQPVEVSHLRPQFAQYLGIGNRRPDLVIRIGHAPSGPKSLRRPPTDVVVLDRSAA
jgi:nitroreductase